MKIMPKLFKKLALTLFVLAITNISFAQVGGWNPELEVNRKKQ